MYSPKVSWVGSRSKRSGAFCHSAQTNSYGVRPRSVFSRFAKLYAKRNAFRCSRSSAWLP